MLDPRTVGPTGVIDWIRAMSAMPAQPDFKRLMVESLISTVCEAEGRPFVAQRIVGVRFDPLFGDLESQNEALPLVEALLAGCPGTEGMAQETIDRLKAVKDEFTDDDFP